MEYSSETPQSRNDAPGAVKVLILLVLALGGLIACSILLLLAGLKPDHISDMYYCIVLQDILAFIAPALAAMAIYYYKPLKAMSLTTAPSWKGILAAVVVCIVSLPGMNWLVEWNKGIELPESLAVLEDSLRAMEDAAEAVTQGMLAGTSVGLLIINLVVVAFMAGFSEEIFFRGTLLKFISPNQRHMHIAIWVVAAVFSAFHMQFYGFVPRMLLGAWFGYLLWWTRSLWVPIIAHALNNSIVVVATWLDSRGIVSHESTDNIGIPADGSFPWLALGSAVATIVLIILCQKWFLKNNDR